MLEFRIKEAEPSAVKRPLSGMRRAIDRQKIPALSFYLRRNDGSWAHDFDILRCGENGACLNSLFDQGHNKFKWIRGRLVKLGLSPATCPSSR